MYSRKLKRIRNFLVGNILPKICQLVFSNDTYLLMVMSHQLISIIKVSIGNINTDSTENFIKMFNTRM